MVRRARIPRSVVPDVYWYGQMSPVLNVSNFFKHTAWIAGPCTSSAINSIYQNITNEVPFTITAGRNLRPTIEVSCYELLSVVNLGKSDLFVRLYRFRNRPGVSYGTAAFTEGTQAAATFSGFSGSNQEFAFPTQYFDWPETSLLENSNFCEVFKPSRVRRRRLPVGRACHFTQNIKKMQISYDEANKAGVFGGATPAGLIANKSYINVLTVHGQLGQVCQTDEKQPKGVTHTSGMFAWRQVQRYVYRWVNWNSYSQLGTILPSGSWNAATATVGNPQVKAYQNVFQDPDGAIGIASRQDVNTNMPYGCSAVAFVPYVNVAP